MADNLENPTGETKTLPPLAPTVESNGDGGGSPPQPPKSTHAATTAIDFEGLRGGKGRRDGLIPGSTEADDADRLYDRVRKWQNDHPGEIHPDEKKLLPKMVEYFARRRDDVARIADAKTRERGQSPATHLRPSRPVESNPPALPSASAVAGSAGSEVRNLDDLAAAAESAFVAWRGTDIEPELAELIGIVKDVRRYKREVQLQLAEIPKEIADEILADSPRMERIERNFCARAGRVLAKLANGFGFSAQWADEIFMAIDFLILAGAELRMDYRLKKFIADTKKKTVPS